MWGYHLIMDVKGSEAGKSKVCDADNIRHFIEELVPSIEMKAYGTPTIQHFAEHCEEAAGYSLVQLIETSSITGHFCDHNGDAYIDIFSCKTFDVDVAKDLVKKYFSPQEIRAVFLERNA